MAKRQRSEKGEISGGAPTEGRQPGARKRPAARRGAARTVAAPASRPARTHEAAQSVEANPAETEVALMERDLDALLGDVRKADSDAEARRRAADAITSIADRLSSQRAADAAGDDPLLPRAKQYLSVDYYLRQLGRRGMRHRSEQVDDFGLDASYEAYLRPFLERMCTKYFRTELEGAANVPERGRALLICNHSGTLPWDGVMLRTALRLHHPAAREARWLIEDSLFHAPFLGAFINRVGAVRACQENAQRLLEREELLAVFPEGDKGTSKSYAQRYKLQRFGRGGYVKLALRTGAPIVPVAIVGAEETYPLLYKVTAFSKALGLPFLPVTPTFPWLGPVGMAPLPSRWHICVGEPVRDLDRHGPEAANDDVLVAELNERVRSEVQRLLSRALERRGQRAFV